MAEIIKFQTEADGVIIGVRKDVVMTASETLANMISLRDGGAFSDDGCRGPVIIKEAKNHRSLEMVFEFYTHHKDHPEDATILPRRAIKSVPYFSAYDKTFVSSLEADKQMFFDLLLLAHYLECRMLYMLLLHAFASRIKRMTPKEIFGYLEIPEDIQLTPEQRQSVEKYVDEVLAEVKAT